MRSSLHAIWIIATAACTFGYTVNHQLVIAPVAQIAQLDTSAGQINQSLRPEATQLRIA